MLSTGTISQVLPVSRSMCLLQSAKYCNEIQVYGCDNTHSSLVFSSKYLSNTSEI